MTRTCGMVLTAGVADRTEYWRERRAVERGGPPREPKPCGTVAAARRHQRNGEPFDPACAAVWKDHQAEMYRNRKSKS